MLQDLTVADQTYLSTIGDDLSKAFVSGADSMDYQAGTTLYKKIDVAGVTVYQYSVNPDSAFYQVKFSQLTQGLGSYVLDNSTANARVFKYVGAGNGNYEPVQYIATPKKKQMVQASFVQKISRHEDVFSDVAYSTNDVNLYSTQDKGNDNGVSVRGGLKSNKRNIGLLNKYLLTSIVSYEFNQENFSAIDRFRTPDFERYWNENVNLIGNNQMIVGNAVYSKNANELISYAINYRDKQNDLSGLQHQAQLYQKKGKLYFKGDLFLTNATNTIGKTNWQKYSANVYYKTKIVTPGFQYSSEKNKEVDSAVSL